MLVFGGQNAGGTMLNEGLAFDPDTKTWTKLSTKNAPAEGGMEGRSVFGGGSAYFFGGNAGANTLNVLGRYTLP